MKQAWFRVAAALVGLTAVAASGGAHAGDVYWSVGVHAPIDGGGSVRTRVGNLPPAPRVVVPPVVVATAPPVIEVPPPRVYRPEPRVVYAPPPPVVVHRGWGEHGRWCEERRERGWRGEEHHGWWHGRGHDRDERWDGWDEHRHEERHGWNR